jgi:trimethylamine--corrinoid protein Co-methyltransferase
MMSDHTLRHMHSAFFEGNGATDRGIRDAWQKAGSMDARKRARDIAGRLIEENKKVYIEQEEDRIIRQSFHILLSEDQ